MPCPPRHPAHASAFPAQPYPCAPPAAGFARPPREGRILAGIQRPPASSARPNPARRGFCPPRYPARRPPPGFVRPRLVRSAARVPCAAYPCLTPVLCAASPCARRFFPAPRGKGGYWQGASACRARRVALRARPHPLRSPIPACRRFFPALRRPRPLRGLTLRAAGFVRRVALRAPVFACVPREGRILAGSQRVPCPPRRPARPPASSARPNPARRGFCPPPVFACALREGRILAGIQRPPVRVLRAA